jgi:hypothetical protein
MLTKRPHHKPLNRAIKADAAARCKCGHAAADHNRRKREIDGVVFDAGACLCKISGRISARDPKTRQYHATSADVPCQCNAFRLADAHDAKAGA